jgi:outer membrane protein OmpA-like peptidoglycan-associated protein
MKRESLILLAIALVLWHPGAALAIPTQYGDTGLLSQPSADTLNAGNICIGLWANHASADVDSATIVPVSLTLGLGSFLEAYGSYPNLLFNDEELASGRGFANIGFKLRVLGKRSSPFKLAIDGQGRRSISDNPKLDGLTDYAGRVIASFKPGRFGIHANAGYVSNEAPKGRDFDDQYVFGGGIELYPAARLRLIAEMEASTEKIKGTDAPREATVGFQYFISPHLTLNLGVGIGLSDASPDWRLLAGFSTCQGIGTYTRPIPKIVEPTAEKKEEKAEPVKVVKVKTLTPLIPKAAAVETAPVSRLEVPVEAGAEEVVVQPSERLVIPETEVLKALPIAPVGSAPAVAVTSVTPGSQVLASEAGALLAKGLTAPLRAVVYRKFRLPEFTFGFDQWNLSEAGKKAIAEVAEQLRKDNRWYIIRVDGHTDSVGSDAYNDNLSTKRAISAATHMVLHNGFEPARMFVKGFGEKDPIASNDTPEGRAENRRIELLVLVPKEAEK